MTIEIPDGTIAAEVRRALLETNYDGRASTLQRAVKRVMESIGGELDTLISEQIRGLFASDEWISKLTSALDVAIREAAAGKVGNVVKSFPREELRPLLKGMMGGMKL